tara:strand:+ start:7393 stop:8262 length:870 start_codon:yes stop_codon:yes gene_type:complete
MAIADSCANNTKNISNTNCEFNQRLPEKYLVAKSSTVVIPIGSTKAQVKALITSGDLFVFPIIDGVNSDNTPDINVETNEFGKSFVADKTLNTAINYKISTSECMMRSLQTWDGVSVYAWMVDVDGGISGDLVDDINLKGTKSKFFFRRPKVRTANTGEFKASMVYLADNDQVDQRMSTDFMSDLDGIIDLDVTVVSSASGSVVIKALAGCNGSEVDGLTASELVIKNAAGVLQTADTFVDNANGTYTFTYGTPLVAGTYTPNLSTTSFDFPGSDTIYGIDPSPSTFTI